jgi:hypothetical protein
MLALPEDFEARHLGSSDGPISEPIRRRVFAIRGEPLDAVACVASLALAVAAVDLP